MHMHCEKYYYNYNICISINLHREKVIKEYFELFIGINVCIFNNYSALFNFIFPHLIL